MLNWMVIYTDNGEGLFRAGVDASVKDIIQNQIIWGAWLLRDCDFDQKASNCK